MIMCVLLCYPVSIRTYYQQGVLFLVNNVFIFSFFSLHIVILFQHFGKCSFNMYQKNIFYCVNTSYPMDHCCTGHRSRCDRPDVTVLGQVESGKGDRSDRGQYTPA